MGLEIERKFKVVGDDWRAAAVKHAEIVQGYLSTVVDRVVRVRTKDGEGALTIKGVTSQASRTEYEYSIPLEDAEHLLHELCVQPLLEKTRYYIPQGDLIWEVDVFHSPQDGLILAEIELPAVDHAFERPPWIGEEVTGDPRFYNQNISHRRP